MTPTVLLIVYCVLILGASLAGGWIPLLIKLTHRRMEIAVSFVAGVMLGVGMLHLLPHALMGARSISEIMLATLGGFLIMFLVERFFSFHHHGVPDEHSCDELADNPEEHEHAHGHQLSWGGAMVGLSIHSIMAGVALAASVQAESHGHASASLAGLGMFLVIFLHKPFDSMTIGTLMAAGRRPSKQRHIVNIIFALAIPLGALLFHLGLASYGHEPAGFVRICLALSAGMFICIALSDLLPELHFHQHDRIGLTVALILGLSLAWVISIFEAKTHGHDHSHDSPPALIERVDDPHAGHDHHGHDH